MGAWSSARLVPIFPPGGIAGFTRRRGVGPHSQKPRFLSGSFFQVCLQLLETLCHCFPKCQMLTSSYFRLSAVTSFHLLLGHIHSLARQQLLKLSAHVNMAANNNPDMELTGIYHYSRLIGSEDIPKFDLIAPSTPVTQHQVL